MITACPQSPAAGTGYAATAVKWVDDAVVASSVVLGITSLSVMFGSLMLDVVVRYATNQGLGWPTEVPNILFPWLVMSGVVLAAQPDRPSPGRSQPADRLWWRRRLSRRHRRGRP